MENWSEIIKRAADLLNEGREDEDIQNILIGEFLIDKWTANDAVEDARAVYNIRED